MNNSYKFNKFLKHKNLYSILLGICIAVGVKGELNTKNLNKLDYRSIFIFNVDI